MNVRDLSYGSYYFIETKAPEGYELDSNPVRFTLDKSHGAGNASPWDIKLTNNKSGTASERADESKAGEDEGNGGETSPAVTTVHKDTAGGGTTRIVATGDDSHMMRHTILLIGSMVILAVCLIYIKKHRNTTE